MMRWIVMTLGLAAVAWTGGQAQKAQFDCSKVNSTYLFSPLGGSNIVLPMGDNDVNCDKKRRVWQCLEDLINKYDPASDAVDFDAFTKKYVECSMNEYFNKKPSWVELAGNRSELRSAGLTWLRLEILVGNTVFDTGDNAADQRKLAPEVMLVKWLDNHDSEQYVKSQMVENVIRVTSETKSTTRAFKTSHSMGFKPDTVKEEDKQKFLKKNKDKKLSMKKGWQTAKRKFREKARETMEILQGKKELEEEEEVDDSGASGSADKFDSVSDTASTTTTTAKMNTFEDTIVVPPKRSAKVVWTTQTRELNLGWETDVFVKGWIALRVDIGGRNLWFLPIGDMASYFHEFFERHSSTAMSYTARGVHRSTQAYESQVDVFEFPLRTAASCPRSNREAAAKYLQHASLNA